MHIYCGIGVRNSLINVHIEPLYQICNTFELAYQKDEVVINDIHALCRKIDDYTQLSNNRE